MTNIVKEKREKEKIRLLKGRTEDEGGRYGRALTCGQVDGVDEGIPALNQVNGYVGKAAVVLHEGRHCSHGLHHLMHQDELLSILQVPLCQAHVHSLVHRATLQGTTVRCWSQPPGPQ